MTTSIGWWKYPDWMEDDLIPVPRVEWLEAGAWKHIRAERRRLAASFVSKGFDDEGTQVRPRALSIIAKDADASVASVKRFLKFALERGLLMKTGSGVTLVKGKRQTPLYRLTKPGANFGVPFHEMAPEHVWAEFASQILPLGDVPLPRHWDDPGPPPDWVSAPKAHDKAAA